MRAVQLRVSVFVPIKCRSRLLMRQDTTKLRLIRSARILKARFDWKWIRPDRMCALWDLFLRVRLARYFWVLRLYVLVSWDVFYICMELCVKVFLMILALNCLNFSFDVDLIFGHFRRVICSVHVLSWYYSALRIVWLARQFLLHVLSTFLHFSLKVTTWVEFDTSWCDCARNCLQTRGLDACLDWGKPLRSRWLGLGQSIRRVSF